MASINNISFNRPKPSLKVLHNISQAENENIIQSDDTIWYKIQNNTVYCNAMR